MNLFLKRKNFFLILAAVFLLSAAVLSAETKAALVIGNGNYRGLSRLSNPVNDARDMAETLEGLGFTVETLLDASLPAMEDGVLRLGGRLAGSSDAVGFFFYAGHGVQSGGVNYLIPADADIRGESFLKTKALAVQSLLDTLQGSRNRLNVIVLDACRDNPYSWSRSGSRGLTVVGNQPPGSIIAYATGAGNTAQDGSGRNGVFTGELLRHLKTPGLDIFDVFRRTGAAVRDATKGAQIPAVYNQFFDGYFPAGKPTVKAEPVPASQAKPAARLAPQPVPVARPEPAGMVWVEGGTFQMGDNFGDGDPDEKPGHGVTVSGFYLGKYEVTVGDFSRFVSETGYKTTAEKSGGGFVYTGKWEQKPDANWRNPYFAQTDGNPVVLVSWYDAVEYCNWLSKKEGLKPAYSGSGNSISCDWTADGYRLPTEAEWEYAAKGGSRSGGYKYSGGNDPGTVGWYNANSGGRTQPVGGKQANELGLFDMTGNVWEWCWDWYGNYTASSMTDPRGPSSGGPRVDRGGSWINDARGVRTANRYRGNPDSRDIHLGFRLVRPRVR